MKNYKKLEECPIIHSKEKFKYLDFGKMPLVNNLTNTREQSLNCPRYPLVVNYYPESKLSMLSVAVDPEILFSNYVYKSGTSQPYIDHCKEMYHYISRFVKLEKKDTIVDIGGNDGTLLKVFREESKGEIYPINVDPSENLGEISKKNGISTLTRMWDYYIGGTPVFRNNCKVITSTNVFQHTEDIRGFVKGVSSALTDDGVWCLEFPYWRKDLETNQYDQVYHEHIYYYLLTPLLNLFLQKGLEIIDVSEQTIHGGSLRVISKKIKGNKNSKSNPSQQKILDEESVFDTEFYKKWADEVNRHIINSKSFLTELKKSGKKIAAFGAAAKGCTFLNAIGIDYNTIDYIVDDTDTKQGKYMPGTGIQIVNRQSFVTNPPDYMLILAHNFSDYIIKSIRPIYDGKIVKMFPQQTIYE